MPASCRHGSRRKGCSALFHVGRSPTSTCPHPCRQPVRGRCSGFDVQDSMFRDCATAWQKCAADALAACGKVALQLRLWTAALRRVLHLQAYSDSRQQPLPKPPWSRTRASVIAAPLLVHSKFPNGSPVLTSSRVPPAAATARRTAGSVRRTSGHHGSPAEHRHC